jgi:hypothetical protein
VSLTADRKREIAYDYVTGLDVRALSLKYGVSDDAIYRLANRDRVFQEHVEEFRREAIQRAKLHLARLVPGALLTLASLARLEPSTEETVHLEEQFGPVVADLAGQGVAGHRRPPRSRTLTRQTKVDPRVLQVKLQAASAIVFAAIRIEEDNAILDHRSIEQELRERISERVKNLTSPSALAVSVSPKTMH